MKTAITSTGPYLESLYDLRFGRCPFLCILDELKDSIEFVPNEYFRWQDGAGSALAQKIIELKIKKVISGDFGPIVQEILKEHNIQMVIYPDNEKTVGDIIAHVRK